MSNEVLVKYCSPTLADIKTGNMFCLPISECKNLNEIISNVNKKVVSKGLRFLAIRKTNKCVLFYLYRPNRLKKDISQKSARKILEDAGYNINNPELCVIDLMYKLKKSETFPHEIGLFLGYPPEDVQGFILNCGKNYKCVGDWKVYGDEKEAKKLFLEFKSCRIKYCRYLKKGISLEKLVV